MTFRRIILSFLFLAETFFVFAQDSASFNWKVTSKKISANEYVLSFSTKIINGWQLYSPDQTIAGVASAELSFPDSLIKTDTTYKETGKSKTIISKIFDNASFKIYDDGAAFTTTIKFNEPVPENLSGIFKYTYGKNDQFYSLTPFSFSVKLEGGVSSKARIKIKSFDIDHPINNCGDESAQGKGLWKIFLLGLVGGLIALLTPCVFPLIPLTVSFFTKQSANNKKGIANAMLYGFFIFLIYIFLSIPFHLLDHLDPEILNNISTNIWLNLLFFVIFVVFAISFFGYFEITLPGSVTNAAGSKSGAGNLAGIFFMALHIGCCFVFMHRPDFRFSLSRRIIQQWRRCSIKFRDGRIWIWISVAICIICNVSRMVTFAPKIRRMAQFSKSCFRIFRIGDGSKIFIQRRFG